MGSKGGAVKIAEHNPWRIYAKADQLGSDSRLRPNRPSGSNAGLPIESVVGVIPGTQLVPGLTRCG
jgi:hypothetical protein